MPADTILLNEHPFSPYAQKIRILLREKRLAFEYLTPDAAGAAGVDLTRVNPRAEVPSLVHEGAVIFDSTIILEYLEERFPTPAMMPAAPAARARARMIEEVCDTHWEAINWGLGEIRFFHRGGDALGPTLRAAAEEQVGHMHAWLAGELGEQTWLSGEAFGWGDLAALPYVTMSSMFGVEPPTGSKLAAWLARGRARPSVAQTVDEALASVPGMATYAQWLEAGAFKRQFRDHRLEWMIRSGGLQVVLDGLAADDIRFTDTAAFAAQHTPRG